jgi:hypothetical protein
MATVAPIDATMIAPMAAIDATQIFAKEHQTGQCPTAGSRLIGERLTGSLVMPPFPASRAARTMDRDARPE